MIYIICFAASALFAASANKAKSRKYFIILSLISIIIPVLLAGLRDYSIGIDTSHYLNYPRYWAGAERYDTLWEYMRYYSGLGIGEHLFAFLQGLIESWTGNFTVFLLVCHGMIITCVYVGAMRLRRYADPVLILLLFYLIYFNQSLNIMRQYMAMSLVFAVLADVPQKKYLRFSLVVLVAFLLHRSALLSFGILAVDWYLRCDLDRIVKIPGKAAGMMKNWLGKNEKEAKQEKASCALRERLRLLDPFRPTILQRQLILFTGLLLLVVIFNPLCRLLIEAGILPDKYSFYLDLSKTEYNLLSTLFILVEMAAIVFLYCYMGRKLPQFHFFFANSLSYLALLQLSFFLVYGRRIAAYFALTNLVTIAMIPRVYTDKTKRAIVTALVIFCALFYWLYVYALRNASQTMPYQVVF